MIVDLVDELICAAIWDALCARRIVGYGILFQQAKFVLHRSPSRSYQR